MRKFLRKIFYFILSFLLIVSLVLISLRTIANKINNNIGHDSIAVIGNSHPQTSVDDKLISSKICRDFKNYGVGGQSMFWSLIGAKKLRHQGTKIFLIELSNGSYTTGWKTTDEARGLREVDKIYFLERADLKTLIKRDLYFTIKLLFRFPIPSKNILGGFLERNEMFKNKLVKENSGSSFTPDFDDKILHKFISDNESSYFVIFRSPQHPNYYKYIGDQNEKFFKRNLDSFQKYENCIVMDFGHKYKNDRLFSDLEHMNEKGALVFSKFLADTLANVKGFKITEK